MNDQQREFQRQEDRISALEEGQKEILELLRPISDTYRSFSQLGKWAAAILVIISVVVGILISLKDLIKK